MGEAQVIVPFIDADGNEQWRTFSIDVGPDDNASSISNRLSEQVEDYINGSPNPSDAPEGLSPILDPNGFIEFEIINWPDF